MTALYADASALLRVLFNEPGSRAPLEKGGVAVTSRIAEIETFRAVDRARLQGHLTDMQTARKLSELAGLLSRLHLVPVSDDIIALARQPFAVNVRAIDAIHVATAQMLTAEVGPIAFWTHDVRQATAALSRGLDVNGA